MPVSFAKLAGDLHRNRKVRKAGRNGRDVYLWVLCQNALHNRDGWVPKADLDDSEYMADELQCDECDVSDGLRHAIESGLLRVEGDKVFIVGWDNDWSRRALTGAERTAKYRERLSSRASHVTACDVDVTRDESDAGEERRREENKNIPLRESEAEARAARKSTRPSGWVPNSRHREQAMALGLDCDRAAQEFADWHESKGSRFANWDAAFRTWLNKAREFAKPKLSVIPPAQSSAFNPRANSKRL